MNIYKISNSVNEKVYIGLTTKTVEERWKGHLAKLKFGAGVSKLYNAMRQIGVDKFKIELIDTAATIQELSDKEKAWVSRLDSIKKGYNICPGGLIINSDSDNHYWNCILEDDKRLVSNKLAVIRQGFSAQQNQESKFYGVSRARKYWRCQMKYQKKTYYRNYKNEEDAAKAYDFLVLYFYGNAAKTNFPDRYLQSELESFYQKFQSEKGKGRGRKKCPSRAENECPIN